ncbi:MAG: leucine-rich repeat domain-containing protein, partial [Clostridia bacterium]|nr:leucine-rich repeat domain-containing protein [Clostridia bacterium]
MKKEKFLEKRNIISLLLVLLTTIVFVASICFLANAKQNNNEKNGNATNISTVYADDEEDETTLDKNVRIENNGTIFTPNLWRALKRFYNKAIQDKATAEGVQVDLDDLVDDYFTIELFKNENFTLTTLDLTGRQIEDITNLKYMDLSMFDEIDLSYNEIEFLDNELSAVPNLKSLNLCGNKLDSFDYTQLHQNCYSQNLIELNLSNNKLSYCNLKQIANNACVIDISLNSLTDSKLTLPENENIVVHLSHNIIDQPNTENANLDFGFQGVKTGRYTVGKKIHFYGYDTYEEIKIYSLSVEDPEAENPTVNETLIKTLNINEENEYEFAIGYYKIKWTDDETDDPYLQDITLYICPKAPIVKMIVNGEELPDIDYKLKRKATIKIIGEETAETFYSINNSAFVKGDEFDIQ